MFKHDECVRLITSNLTNLGVNSKTKQVTSRIQTKIAASEVTREALNGMDIHEIMNNVELYEQEVAQSVSGEALSLSEVQTLITLYQKAIEYYSAFDDH